MLLLLAWVRLLDADRAELGVSDDSRCGSCFHSSQLALEATFTRKLSLEGRKIFLERPDAGLLGPLISRRVSNRLQILDKVEVCVRNNLEVALPEVDLRLGSLLLGPLGVVLCQSQGCLARVSNLAAVPSSMLMLFVILLDMAEDLGLFHYDTSALAPEPLADKLQIKLQHLLRAVLIERWVV